MSCEHHYLEGQTYFENQCYCYCYRYVIVLVMLVSRYVVESTTGVACLQSGG